MAAATGSKTALPLKPAKQTTKTTASVAAGIPIVGNMVAPATTPPATQADTRSGSPAITGFSTPQSGFANPAGATSQNSIPSLTSVNQPGTAGSLGNNPGYNQGNSTPVTGGLAGYGYTPQGLGTLYNNPVDLATQILAGMGINNPGLAQTLSQTLDPAVAANFLLNNGMNSSDNGTLNFANQYMQNQVTPNGRSVDFGSLVNHLLGAGGAQDSPLGAYLNASLDPSQQVQAGNALFGQTLGNLNPYAQQAYSRYAKDMGSQYQGDVARGNPGATSYIDWLNNNSNLGQWARRG